MPNSGAINSEITGRLKAWLKRDDVRYGLFSIACPIMAFVAVSFYLSIANAGFREQVMTNPEDDANHHAGALMALSEMVVLIYSMVIASVIGSLSALISVRKQRGLTGIGLLGLLVNSVPLALFLLLVSRLEW